MQQKNAIEQTKNTMIEATLLLELKKKYFKYFTVVFKEARRMI